MNQDRSNLSERAVVFGAGSWGSALAHLLASKGVPTSIWSFSEQEACQLSQERTLPSKLPGFSLHKDIVISSKLDLLLEKATVLVFAVPSCFTRSTAVQVGQALGDRARGCCVVSASKGFEMETLKSMSTVLGEELDTPSLVALSGPTHAEEVVLGLPTTVVAASRRMEAACRAQSLFMAPSFRVYTSEDVLGVELGGALKNLVAIAAGAAAGMGFGDNTMAALVTRGLAEITRLGVAMGADPLTFSGLSGLGDLVVTCASRHSRNRRLGIALAAGKTLDEALKEIGMVVEGVEMARSVKSLVQRYGVEMPIAVQVAETLFEGVPVKEAVRALMLRDPKPEVQIL